ncbi:hypothetical protein [Arthrobacter sp. E3]|uniref:hypothetical protein n=1 Tax=Arthrobacter sp. E3 TaxID=517402 RepID=UPI001A9474AD|nr:hypothetical protein [Arthrobacter sp. E3]
MLTAVPLEKVQLAKRILATNEDEDAPIFDVADVGILGDSPSCPSCRRPSQHAAACPRAPPQWWC